MHFHDANVVDVRLTSGEIAARRGALRIDDRVVLRASPGSDWLEVTVRSGADVDFVVELVTVAATANRR